jgi:thiamine pyrophosphate-dependent acetolactate synthase large subunit-like protein
MSIQLFESSSRQAAKVMNRSDLARRLVVRLNNEEAVVAGIGNTHFDLWASGQRPQNYYMLGSMGLAVPIALGVALAQRERQIFALEGDGSLLMQLGALGTVAFARPKNLAIIVFDNGAYQITGGQSALTATNVDLVAIAKGAGLAQSAWAKDETHYEALIDCALAGEGPIFIGTRTDDQPPAGVTDRDAARIRIRFMDAMKVAPRGNPHLSGK